ncbi:hypothetical protein KHA80_17640 [Anaerobacillus sp. HL2]|nr:hypothetical protein KHA80_17640 [Anaerobacillus sp. HL2]
MNYSLVYLTDTEGNVVFSTIEGLAGQNMMGREYIQRALKGESRWSLKYFSQVS